jgi:hypothetical protein
VIDGGAAGVEPYLRKLWNNIKQRCRNGNSFAFSNYGAKGVALYGPWLDSVEQFVGGVVREAGLRPSPIYSLDRWPDREGFYRPGNIRWATPGQQARNRSNNYWIAHEGKTLCAAEWSEKLGGSLGLVGSRIRSGWSMSDAVTTPPGAQKGISVV